MLSPSRRSKSLNKKFKSIFNSQRKHRNRPWPFTHIIVPWSYSCACELYSVYWWNKHQHYAVLVCNTNNNDCMQNDTESNRVSISNADKKSVTQSNASISYTKLIIRSSEFHFPHTLTTNVVPTTEHDISLCLDW